MAEQNYYLLGAVWKGHNPEDQSKRFIENDIWENGYENKFIDTVAAVEIGARVAIKSKCTRGPGHQISVTKIKIIGTVIENPHDGITLKIKWDDDFEEFDFDGGGYFKTISRVRNKRYINKVFFHDKQHIESRIARLTWNTKGWKEPSGRTGKSTASESYENENGFGHEEWLFDFDKIIDGYHYGFLEPVGKQYDAYKGNLYDVWLYGIDGESQKRYWVGEIKNLQVLQGKEAQHIYNEYRQKGWLLKMQQQLENLNLDGKKFSGDNPINIFNVKFRPENLNLNYPLVELPQAHPINSLTRYVFSYFKEEFKIIDNSETSEYVFQPTSSINPINDLIQPIRYERDARPIEIPQLHKIISNKLVSSFRDKYGVNNVKLNEYLKGVGIIDIVLNNKGNIIFYEIKTYPSIKTSIREAIGQLMEYALWPQAKRAKELIIVTHRPIEKDVEIYLKHIRDTYQIQIYYQSYDYKNDILSEKY